MTGKDSVLLVGRGALAEDLGGAARDAGYRVLRIDDLRGIEREAPAAAIAIEACVTDHYRKQEVLTALGNALMPQAMVLVDALPATVAECASWLGQPRQCVGYGVLGRLRAQHIVEIARGSRTAEGAVERAKEFFTDLGIETRSVGDWPGLIGGRTIATLANEAAWAVTNGVASAADVDRAMQLGTNYPRGPLAWAQEIGIDRILTILENLRRHDGEAYAPAPLWLELAARHSEARIGVNGE
ncbi:MAG: hypothetical protein KGM44_11360 [bacterium]|nr:hypothetical protein [bacterium]